jgi:hypothetical protein
MQKAGKSIVSAAQWGRIRKEGTAGDLLRGTAAGPTREDPRDLLLEFLVHGWPQWRGMSVTKNRFPIDRRDDCEAVGTQK